MYIIMDCFDYYAFQNEMNVIVYEIKKMPYGIQDRTPVRPNESAISKNLI